MKPFDLTGRVAVVTGGNGGIGRGIALGLGAAGAKVAVLGRNEVKNQRVLSELKALGIPSIAVSLDVTNRPGLEPALGKVESELGEIDVLVNNAGNVSLSGGVLNETAEDWDNVIETQLNAVFLLSKLAAKSMMSRKAGKLRGPAWNRSQPAVRSARPTRTLSNCVHMSLCGPCFYSGSAGAGKRNPARDPKHNTAGMNGPNRHCLRILKPGPNPR